MTITEICLIIITLILVLRAIVEVSVLLNLKKKISPLLDQVKKITANFLDVSSLVKEESVYIKDTFHEISSDTKKHFDTFKQMLGKINKNLFLLNAVLKSIIGSFNFFFNTKDDKEK